MVGSTQCSSPSHPPRPPARARNNLTRQIIYAAISIDAKAVGLAMLLASVAGARAALLLLLL